MFRVMTVCTGNICRSPMAALMLARALAEEGLGGDVEVRSAGTSGWERGRPVDPRARAVLEADGIDATDHRAREFDPDWFADLDLVLAMDVDHYDALREQAPDPRTADKVRMFREFVDETGETDPQDAGISDPWYGTDADFVDTHRLIAEALPSLVAWIREHRDAGATHR
ncbi:protein-tyrosine-phosphatase [Tersicoccus solisilvae]|uniref:protein-tyrosine-phosphatase n=1 Tax=Tersicoccus solisilvae TaxID=1882339 RepID=A0ABQ1NM09_9MICC|nr:low molecular weight protein-tyrosine-phosphatase [Tersicoccus solisilvae]GGC80424.1 protein-tyrosine-phosphatase [Tersicoccus solisilvae]